MSDASMIEKNMILTKDDMFQKVDQNIAVIKPWLRYLMILAVFFGAACFVHFRSPAISDPDSFYYMRHSWLLRTNGIFDTQFPWTQYSVVRLLGTDLWYGFHLFLMPFTYFQDLIFAIKISGFVITFLVLVMCFFAFKNLGVRFPAFWSLALLFSTPDVLYRMAMARPHPLSFGLNLLIFSLLIQKSNKSSSLIFIFSFLLAFVHPAFFWLPFAITAVICFCQGVVRQPISWTQVLALISGTLAGLFARPHPIASLKLLYIQLVEWSLARQKLLLAFGTEHSPPSWNIVIDDLGLLIFIAVPLVIFLTHLFLFRPKEKISAKTKVVMMSSLILTVVFLFLYFHVRRASDLFVGYFFILAAVATTYSINKVQEGAWVGLRKHVKLLLMAMVLGSVLMGSHAVARSAGYLEQARLMFTLKEPALWLRENTKKEEIVFHVQWGHFPVLFFWNQKNFYINGMDPVFLYAYNPTLYWKMYYMAYHNNLAGITCGYEKCGPEMVESVHDVLVRDFKANYVFLRKDFNPGLCNYMENDRAGFEKVFDDSRDVIFKVLPNSKLSVSRTPERNVGEKTY